MRYGRRNSMAPVDEAERAVGVVRGVILGIRGVSSSMPAESLVTRSLESSRCVISVIGAHAGELPDVIFERKSRDISHVGRTFWLIRSYKAKPGSIQKLCAGDPAYVIFVAPSTSGGARPTETDDAASEYSVDGVLWNSLPSGLTPVTGKLDRQSSALVFDALATVRQEILLDIWNYAELDDPDKPIRTMLGCSSIGAIRKDTRGHVERMKSQYRPVIAVARLSSPYGVWVR
jgi:hypothetical protein